MLNGAEAKRSTAGVIKLATQWACLLSVDRFYRFAQPSSVATFASFRLVGVTSSNLGSLTFLLGKFQMTALETRSVLRLTCQDL